VAVGERLHSLLGCEFGGAFDRFRAVHDHIGHAGCGYGFISMTSVRRGALKTVRTAVLSGSLSQPSSMG
jgi:hypothetical protein